jgi:hypothetical protein
LQENPHRIHWFYLSLNPEAIALLKENLDKIDWFLFSRNPSIFELKKNSFIESILYSKITLRTNITYPTLI